jgi:hypothetical protein
LLELAECFSQPVERGGVLLHLSSREATRSSCGGVAAGPSG